ncbi:hypothetical protein N7528_009599 [Penicillium herquei]|nr:hypothetical protein N7528_009599 [Penicillium herquei]
MYHGEVIYTAGLGYADVENCRVPDQDTIYTIASCTKGITGTAFSILEQQNKLKLGDLVSKHLPGFNTVKSPAVSRNMTIKDMLSHCSGLSPLPYEVIGKDGAVFARHENILQICNNLPRQAEFRSEWMYNNWMFALAGLIITQESGVSFGEFIRQEIFNPLKMKRTSCSNPEGDDNYARPYLVYGEGRFEAVSLPTLVDEGAFDSSGSVRSCVRDVLLWTEALMAAWNASHLVASSREDENIAKRAGLTSWLKTWFKCQPRRDPNSPDTTSNHHSIPKKLAEALKIVQVPHFALASDFNQSYGLGLFTLQLPTSEMNTVTNADVIKKPYCIGERSLPMSVVGHTGELGGYLSAYWTFPEEESSVVVLCNSFQLNGDPTNIVAQAITQALFDLEPKVDFVLIAKDVVKNAKARWNNVVNAWTSNRISGTRPKDTITYNGIFKNEGLVMRLSINSLPEHGDNEDEEIDPRNSKKLQLRINNCHQQTFDLYHYHHDAWTFLPKDRDECIRNGFSAYLYDWNALIIYFKDYKDGHFGSVSWRLDPDVRVEEQCFQNQDR